MIYYKILSHQCFLFDPTNSHIIVIIVDYIYIYINHIITMMIIAIISLLFLHFTDEEIESEGLGVRQGLAKTYN